MHPIRQVQIDRGGADRYNVRLIAHAGVA